MTINGDTKTEPDEAFNVEVTNLVGAEKARSVATGTIVNDDEAPPPPPPGKISIGNGASGESGGSVSFLITVTGAHPEVTFNYHTENGSATAPSDYQSINTAGPRIAAGASDASVEISIPIVDDQIDETSEQFLVVLSDIVGATFDGGGSTISGIGTIENDDNNSSVSIGDATVEEGATAQLSVSLAPVSGRQVNVSYTIESGTAGAGRFTATSGSVPIQPGSTTATIPVVTNADDASHPNETVVVKITAAGAKVGKATGTVTIVDKQAPPTLAIGDATAPEGGAVVFTVSLLGSASGGNVTVAFATVDGAVFPNAIAPGDYSSASGTLTFAAGEKSKTISIATVDDSTSEADEVFFLQLSSPQGAVLSTPSRGVGKIIDNDGGTPPPPPRRPDARHDHVDAADDDDADRDEFDLRRR